MQLNTNIYIYIYIYIYINNITYNKITQVDMLRINYIPAYAHYITVIFDNFL